MNSCRHRHHHQESLWAVRKAWSPLLSSVAKIIMSGPAPSPRPPTTSRRIRRPSAPPSASPESAGRHGLPSRSANVREPTPPPRGPPADVHFQLARQAFKMPALRVASPDESPNSIATLRPLWWSVFSYEITYTVRCIPLTADDSLRTTRDDPQP